ncbi:RNA-binding protein 41 isoform X2 [Pimephales promelas]|uniref:RNA-binding protein 41 isoform X2 n=1 Tax=Pimephales promelas TaxID=90988 RepID=UPI001955F341|nr:RNA-binding protein 41 isoform X2 [Pimephales promelas]
MKRVTRLACDDVPVPEEQETEGQRQLHNLLIRQLDTEANIERCVAKRKCFAPAAVYKPFGEQAAGVRSLSQFQALQDGDQELAALRELGLTDAEIQLWRSRDRPESSGKGKGRGVCVAPEARDMRLQAIRDKLVAHAELLARPQRFSSSRPLSRREMEIEKALFHGSDRSSFLTALYHREEPPVRQQGATSAVTLDHFCKDFLEGQNKHVASTSECFPQPQTASNILCKSSISKTDQSARADCDSRPSKERHVSQDPGPVSDTVQSRDKRVETITVSQSIGSLSAAVGQEHDGPVTVSGRIEDISEEEIENNRETEEDIRRIPRFKNYQRGDPSSVLCVKNMSPRATVAQLVSLFSRFEKDDERPIRYRLLTGRLKGQAFITLSDVKRAHDALDLLNGYKLLDRPLVIEFGRERRTETDGSSADPKAKDQQSCYENPSKCV